MIKVEQLNNQKYVIEDGKVLFSIVDNTSAIEMLINRINELEDKVEELENEIEDWEENGTEKIRYMLS